MVENVYVERWKSIRCGSRWENDLNGYKVLAVVLYLGEGELTGEGIVFISINLPVESVTTLPLIFR